MRFIDKVIDKALQVAGLGRVVNRPEVDRLYKRDHPSEPDRGTKHGD